MEVWVGGGSAVNRNHFLLISFKFWYYVDKKKILFSDFNDNLFECSEHHITGKKIASKKDHKIKLTNDFLINDVLTRTQCESRLWSIQTR